MPNDTTQSLSYLEGFAAGRAYGESLRGTSITQPLAAKPADKRTLHLASNQPMRQDEVKPTVLYNQFREDSAPNNQSSASAARKRMLAGTIRTDAEEAQIRMDSAMSRMDTAQFRIEAGSGKTSAAALARRRMVAAGNSYAFTRPSERADQQEAMPKRGTSAADARARMLRGD